jgi:hypothetical protein
MAEDVSPKNSDKGPSMAQKGGRGSLRRCREPDSLGGAEDGGGASPRRLRRHSREDEAAQQLLSEIRSRASQIRWVHSLAPGHPRVARQTILLSITARWTPELRAIYEQLERMGPVIRTMEGDMASLRSDVRLWKDRARAKALTIERLEGEVHGYKSQLHDRQQEWRVSEHGWFAVNEGGSLSKGRGRRLVTFRMNATGFCGRWRWPCVRLVMTTFRRSGTSATSTPAVCATSRHRMRTR